MAKILWMSPFSLHDTSSGAAVNCRYLLSSLQKRGFEVWTCSAFIFAVPNGSQQAFDNLEEMLARTHKDVFNFKEDGIDYVYTLSLIHI